MRSDGCSRTDASTSIASARRCPRVSARRSGSGCGRWPAMSATSSTRQPSRGRGFWAATIASAVGRATADVLAALEGAERMGLVRRDGTARSVRFSARAHPGSDLRRPVVDERVRRCTAGWPTRSNRDMPDTSTTHLAELAHHYFEASTAGSIAKAIGYSRRAGRQASGSCVRGSGEPPRTRVALRVGRRRSGASCCST